MPAQQHGKAVLNTWNEALISHNLVPQEDSLCKLPSLVSQLTSKPSHLSCIQHSQINIPIKTCISEVPKLGKV